MTMNNRINRRGVTLLIVLSLMTMFALLVVAFMVITTQARRAAEHAAQAVLDPKGGDAGHSVISSEMDVAIQKLLIGDKLESVIGPHSILENLYGHPIRDVDGDKFTYNFTTVANIISDGTAGDPTRPGTFIFHKNFPIPVAAPINVDSTNTFSRGDLTGYVLTVTSGDLKGKSTFILAYNCRNPLDSTDPDFGFKLAPFNEGTAADQATKLPSQSFIINSPAFGGTGPGFNPGAASGGAALEGKDDEVDDTTGDISFGIGSGKPLALRPNILAPEKTSPYSQRYQKYLEKNLVLMNPDYTAPDYLNMFLAWNDVQNPSGTWHIDHIIPSFHRPQLLKYWENVAQNEGTPSSIYTAANYNELRKIVLRPLPTDHPNFTGSNPAAKAGGDLEKFLTEGPWDVDNDGDGIADGVWLDVGLGTVTIGNKKYKKLVSYYVLDMDGRLNVNVHGNPGQITADNATDLFGSGSGPAEVRLDIGLGISPANFEKLLKGDGTGTDIDKGRYGTAVNPAGTIDILDTDIKMGVNPEAYGGFSGGFGGNAPDWWGSAKISFTPLGNRDFAPTTFALLFGANPYLMNPYETGADSPFDPFDLQYLIRSVGDVDYATLPKRLRNLLGDGNQYNLSQYRLFLGTRSSDIPVFSRFGGATISSGTSQGLYNYIDTVIYPGSPSPTVTIGGVSIKKADALWELLPEEIRRGEKVNLNRLTLRSDWTNEFYHDGLLKEKAKFAQEIYYLLCVLCYDQITNNAAYSGPGEPEVTYARLAQWSVNLVDFIDPDATMTPFVFSIDPFNDFERNEDIYKDDGSGIETEGHISKVIDETPPSGNYRLIWGMEKPEVALTKTLAVHNRRVADSIGDPTATDAADVCSDGNVNIHRLHPGCQDTTKTHDDKFDQVKEPESSLFVELYRQGDGNRLTYPADGLGLNGTTPPTLDLTLKSGPSGTGDPIWRLAIGEKAKEKPTDTSSSTIMNDVFHELATKGLTYSFQDEITPERFIYFGSGSPSPTEFYNANTTTYPAKLAPNEYLVIAPRPKTSFQSKSVDGGSQKDFGTPTNATDTVIDLTTMSGVKTMIATDVNVTEKVSGYATPSDAPPYSGGTTYPEIDGLGTILGYKAIFLQRLADPTRAYHAKTNPYITVDWNMIDLHVINSERDTQGADDTVTNPQKAASGTAVSATQDAAGMKYAEKLKFAIRQWGYSNWKARPVTAAPNIWDRSFDADETNWKGSDTAQFDDESQDASGLFLGRPANGIDLSTDKFVHFPWHDAPLANTYELMLVPACTQGQFGFKFHDNINTITDWESSGTSLGTTGMRFAGTDGTNDGGSPYLNFFASGTNSLDLSRLFEYVRVPSKFAGTISGWIPEDIISTPPTPLQLIYAMREPGKINLNTATAPAWDALKGNSGRTWNDYETANGLYGLRNRSTTTEPSEFVPFRSPQMVNLVPPGVTPGSAADATLLRPGLLKPEANSDNPYTALESVMRLSDMTTTRSNVFAVWVTVGYFEAEHFANSTAAKFAYPVLSHITTDAIFNAVYPDGYVLGAEKGLDDGTVKRHRAFYLIDRSTPVGFRRGDNTTNFKDVIVDSKILE